MFHLPKTSWRGYQPLAIFLLALIVGLSLASLWPGSRLIFGFSACCLVGLWLLGQRFGNWGRDRGRCGFRLRTFWLLMATVMVGGFLSPLSGDLLSESRFESFAENQSRPLVLIGTVIDAPERVGQFAQPWTSVPVWRYRVRVEQVRTDQRWESCLATLEVRETGAFNHRLPGDQCRWTGRLELVPQARNPGDAPRGRLDPQRSIGGWLILPAGQKPEVLGWRSAFPYRGFAAWRQAADLRLKQALPGEPYAMARALTLGLRDELSPQVRQLFQEAGISHLLAISGFHVSILIVVLITPAVHFGVDRRVAFWALTLVLFIYLGVSGMRPSVLRATLCVVITLASRLRKRRPTTTAVLICAATVLLLGDIGLSFDLGTQLSFLGVYLLTRVTEPQTDKTVRWVMQRTRNQWSLGERFLYQGLIRLGRGLEATVLVVLGTLPLVAHHFHCVAAAGLLVNPMAVIPSSVLLVASLALTLPWPDPVSSALCAALVEISYATLIGMAEWGRCWLPARFAVGPSVALLWVGYPALLIADRIAFRFGCRWPWWLGLVLLNVVTLGEPEGTRWLRWSQGDRAKGQVNVMDVAHGTAVMVENGRGEVWMYDGGSSSGSKLASRVVLQWLQYRQVNVIERWFLSHPDRDHFNGCAELLGRVPIKEVVVPAVFRDAADASWQRFLERCRTLEIPIVYCRAGDVWHDGFNLKCRAMHPSTSVQNATDNDSSLVLDVELAGHRILLTGDVEGAVSRRLASEAGHADVLVAPHHGGASSDVGYWISKTQTSWVVVSSNRPKMQFSKSASSTQFSPNVQVWNTANRGAITIHLDSGSPQLSSWLRE